MEQLPAVVARERESKAPLECCKHVTNGSGMLFREQEEFARKEANWQRRIDRVQAALATAVVKHFPKLQEVAEAWSQADTSAISPCFLNTLPFS